MKNCYNRFPFWILRSSTNRVLLVKLSHIGFIGTGVLPMLNMVVKSTNDKLNKLQK